jgi:hypothetical protein
MAYMLQCIAGYNAPARQGSWDVVGMSAAVQDPTVDSELCIIDDVGIGRTWKCGRFLSSLPTEQKGVIAYAKGDGSAYDTFLEWTAPEPVKTRYGISLITTNVKPGTVCVYVR